MTGLNDGTARPQPAPVDQSLQDQVQQLRRRVRLMAGAMLELPEESRATLCRQLLVAEGRREGRRHEE